MKRIYLALVAPFLLLSGALPQSIWQPADGLQQVPIWPGKPPDAIATDGPEKVTATKKSLVAGRPWQMVENVSIPTMTVYPPAGANTGAAVIVFPGGGYKILAIDLEGSEPCEWLTSQGITCVLLKYRVPAPWKTWYHGAYPETPIALDDAQRTISLVRSRAAELHVDPHKIGVLGFSAGGHLVTAVSVHWTKRIYARVDSADDVSCRPDFAIAMYPGHLSRGKGTLHLNEDIASRINAQTPPTFLLQNEDDPTDTIWDSISYYAALVRAGVPVELHAYATGKHGFGLRPTDEPSSRWPALVEVWLRTIGVLQGGAKAGADSSLLSE